MKPLLLLLTYAIARPGYHYEFPRDHFSHPEFQTEWWYYTGNLKDTASGRRFGFELTFFRVATSEDRRPRSVWDPTDLYIAHLTLSDIEGARFIKHERINRAGPGVAGADFTAGRIWNGNWEARLDGLKAVAEDFRFQFKFHSAKPPVIHGENGISRKAAGLGNASHYVSFTRLETSGVLTYAGRDFQLTGTTWMDHEFFTNQLTKEQIGWDWFSIQLDSKEELMLVRIRRKDGSVDPYSHGAYVDTSGRSRYLKLTDFSLTAAADRWTSSRTGAAYPLRWTVEVPSISLKLEGSTPLPNQELVLESKLTSAYWEGAMDYRGTLRGAPIKGVGYLEMTGYAGAVRMGDNK
ncbi:MAG: carotenoid 1,2-hydratase [Bryobacterales bacterium]|nr:carotenoid 1,2-hydratase [Bryobacterales bacterium]